MRSVVRAALIGVQLVGCLLSALLVMVTYSNPAQVEERLQSFAIAKVEQAADVALSAGAAQLHTDKMGALAQRFGRQADRLEHRRQQIVPALLAQSLSKDCTENCAFWARAAATADTVLVQRIARMRIGQQSVQDFVETRYANAVQGLLRDLRRFGLVTGVVLALMLGLVWFRDHLNWRFGALSFALTGYTAWAAYGYMFKQNWALSILLQDWAAPGYQAGMILIACLFFDWLFLRGRVTDFAINALGSLLPG